MEVFSLQSVGVRTDCSCEFVSDLVELGCGVAKDLELFREVFEFFFVVLDLFQQVVTVFVLDKVEYLLCGLHLFFVVFFEFVCIKPNTVFGERDYLFYSVVWVFPDSCGLEFKQSSNVGIERSVVFILEFDFDVTLFFRRRDASGWYRSPLLRNRS